MLDLLQALLNWRTILDLVLVAIVVYVALRFLQGTRGAGILKGLALVLLTALAIMVSVGRELDLKAMNLLSSQFLSVIVVATVVIFQPEFRRALVRLGENPFLRIVGLGRSELVSEVTRSAAAMSRGKIGALIAIEMEVGLGSYIEGGEAIDAEIKAELLRTIFWPGTPLHDGGVILRGGRIAAAGCLFPLTDNPEISRALGTRHRAGVGVTEDSDAVAVIVSEETGRIAVARRGRLYEDVGVEGLKRMLTEFYAEKTRAAAGDEASLETVEDV